MKRYYLAALMMLAGIVLISLASCNFECVKASGNQVSENRKVNDFTRIDVSGAFKVILKQDSSLNIAVIADDNIQKYIKTDVSGNRLRISTASKNICNGGQIVVTIGVHNLEAIKLSGANELSADGKLVAGDINFKLSGVAKVNLDIDAANVKTEGSGATEIVFRG